jgi:hypothetical protein
MEPLSTFGNDEKRSLDRYFSDMLATLKASNDRRLADVE